MPATSVPGLAQPSQADADSDGIGDYCDNCQLAPNPDQANGDRQLGIQWAVTASASSEWSSTDWSAAQATGPPELAQCSSVETNWSPLGDGSTPEWIELGYDPPVRPVGVDVHESGNASGFVTRVDVRDTTGLLHTVWEESDPAVCGGIHAPRWSPLPFDVTSIVVHSQLEGWEEIDAVGAAALGAPAPDLWGNACDLCPFVSVGGPQQDYDGDGVGDECDCSPNDATARPADDVRSVAVAKPAPASALLTWGNTAGADAYTVSRATLSEIRSGSYGDCVRPSQPLTEYSDDELPAPGEAFAYLVRGVSDSCGIGTLGAGPGGFERINPDPDACW